jgi:hypothetical protein
MEKKKKKSFAIPKNVFFFPALFLVAPLALHFRDDL